MVDPPPSLCPLNTADGNIGAKEQVNICKEGGCDRIVGLVFL